MKKPYLLVIICLFAASTTIAQENNSPESRDNREILQDDFRSGLSKSIEDLSVD